ncbi:MAG: ATP synthase F1 subunit epsilon [Bacteroidota bacterium]
MKIKLVIVTPEKKIFTGEVHSVRLPGAEGPFEVFPNHAPIISWLEKGPVTYNTGVSTQTLAIDNGLAIVKENKVTVLI